MRDTFGVEHLRLDRKSLRKFFGIDNIFLYQFGVYFTIWIWALTVLLEGRSTDHRIELALIVAPLIVLIGYIIVGKLGTLLCAGGDLVMSYCTGIKSYEEFQDHGCFSFSVALIGAISLCMFVRMLRDLIIIFTRDTDRIETILEVTGGTDE